MSQAYSLILLLIGLALPVLGQPYYVAPTGSDGNPGTLAKPFATIQRAQQAVRQQPGPVWLRGGTGEGGLSRPGTRLRQLPDGPLWCAKARFESTHAHAGSAGAIARCRITGAEQRWLVGAKNKGKFHNLLRALSTAFIGASSMLVSTPAPHRVLPSGVRMQI
jgi:hypothetical protein